MRQSMVFKLLNLTNPIGTEGFEIMLVRQINKICYVCKGKKKKLKSRGEDEKEK